ncbi:uncharacterized protein LOC125576128 [Brassica napus]|uniref:uncharacterized protein LOC125576128 n=1 Tax=Brassica napus TaxID=3708 RepID=UPI0020791451|nr:uncharacterized protein LOC125576128 [Brassica napus]
MCWVAWDKLTAPKTLGGLGIRYIQAFNTALLAKQAWRIVSKPDCLLSRVLRAKYCGRDHFLKVEAPKAASHGWRGILTGRDLLVTNLSRAIGNGESTRVWKDPWLSTLSPVRPIGPAREEDQDLVVADLICRGSNEWNVQRVERVLPQYLNDILRIKPSILGSQDSYVWLAARSGSYSAKSGYHVAISMELQEQRDPEDLPMDQNLYKTIWASKVSPKLQLFLWRITQGALALGENLARRRIMNNTSCRHCGEPETATHVFLHCPLTRRVWSTNIWESNFNPSECNTFEEAFLRAAEATNLPPIGIAGPLFPWICWDIWTARNYRIFENKIPSPDEIISKALRAAREWNAAQSTPEPGSSAQRQHTLQPSSTFTSIACFTDAAWQAGTNKAGCGWIFPDCRNEGLCQRTKTFSYISSALMAEAMAVRSALINAREMGFSKICIKSDCQALVAIISSNQHPADLHGITRDIEHLSLSFDCISYVFILRNLNFVADALAKSALYSVSTN